MYVELSVLIETDEFPDKEEKAMEKAKGLLEKKLQDQLTTTDVEDYELLDEPRIGEPELVDK